MKRWYVLFAIGFLFLFTSIVFAQESGEFDWGSLGVDTGIVVGIIAVVQLLKKYIPEKLVVFAPIILAVIAFFAVRQDQPIVHVVYWAAAAGYFWKIANQLTPSNLLKSKTQIDAS